MMNDRFGDGKGPQGFFPPLRIGCSYLIGQKSGGLAPGYG